METTVERSMQSIEEATLPQVPEESEVAAGEHSEAKARPGWITFWGYSNSILEGLFCLGGLGATSSGENEGFLVVL